MSLWILTRLLLYGALLWALLRGFRLLVALLPMGPSRRRSLQHALPVVEFGLGALFALAVVRELFDGWAEAAGLLGLVFGGLWVSRFAWMDLVAGVVLRASGQIAVGDRVRVQELEGRVSCLGTRALTLETRSGDEARIPYGLLSRQSVVHTPLTPGSHRHTFRIEGDAVSEPDQLRRYALLSHWSAVARPPVIGTGPDRAWEVTVFAVAPDRGPDIEAFVRGCLAAERELGESPRREPTKRRAVTPPVA